MLLTYLNILVILARRQKAVELVKQGHAHEQKMCIFFILIQKKGTRNVQILIEKSVFRQACRSAFRTSVAIGPEIFMKRQSIGCIWHTSKRLKVTNE